MKSPGGNPRAADAVDWEVGRRIAARRVGLGLSQMALAQRVGVSFQQLQKYEGGLNRVSASRLHQIAAALGTQAGVFFPAAPLSPASPSSAPAAGLDPARDAGSPLRAEALMASSEGRLVAARFPLIADRATRRAVARVIQALSVAA